MHPLYILPPLLLLTMLLGACDKDQDKTSLQGYVEGRPLHLAARDGGIITALTVEEGDSVEAETVLFSVDATRAEAQLKAATSAKSAAESQLADLKKGARPEEIKAATETLTAAEANLVLAQKTYDRSKTLVERGHLAVAALDQARATLDAARAKTTEARARLAVLRLPARPDAIIAAQHGVDMKSDEVIRAREDLKDRSITAPVSGRIETIYRRTGEITGPTLPVLSLLPQNMKQIRFFVPEPLLSSVHYGDMVALTCDGCPDGLQGSITFISDQAEFTPPVIFTKTERAKLMYRIDANPDHPEQFHNGQPVNVTLMTQGSKPLRNSTP